MSLQARRELLNSLRPRYREASKIQKIKILDEFIQVTQYGRKHAIALLNKDAQETQRPKGTGRKRKYDEQIKKVLIRNDFGKRNLIRFGPRILSRSFCRCISF